MKVTRIHDAKAYEAKNHFGMVALRLQGEAASDCHFASLGLSHFLPGGGAQESASNIEKLYVVVSGEITVVTENDRTVLRELDSCLLAAGEARSLINETNLPASMLVILPSATRLA
ncbi:MAG: cupin [Shinella sp.]|nr:MAG: cupin [Shinella sp.]